MRLCLALFLSACVASAQAADRDDVIATLDAFHAALA